MNDAVTKILALADAYRDQPYPFHAEARQALQDELVRLFTPLTDAQIENMAMDDVGLIIDDDSPFCDSDIMEVFELVRNTEKAHGITGKKTAPAERTVQEPTRFDMDMDGSMEPSEFGRWVRYEDI